MGSELFSVKEMFAHLMTVMTIGVGAWILSDWFIQRMPESYYPTKLIWFGIVFVGLALLALNKIKSSNYLRKLVSITTLGVGGWMTFHYALGIYEKNAVFQSYYPVFGLVLIAVGVLVQEKGWL